MMNSAMTAIRSKALSPPTAFGISRPNLDSGKGEPEYSRVSGTFSTKVIGAKSARKVLCPRCLGITTAGSNSFSRVYLVYRSARSDCITASHNKSVDFQRYLTLLVEVFSDKPNRDEQGINASD